MNNEDKTINNNNLPISPVKISDDKRVIEDINKLVKNEKFAILCTQADNQPYGSIIAYALTENLKYIVFSTPIDTRKYSLLSKCNNISLVIDDRSKLADDIIQISAVTITGQALQIKDNVRFDLYSKLLVSKHPYLEKFIYSPTSVLILIESLKYFYVSSFQEVYEWEP